MQKSNFDQVVTEILLEDTRFDAQAYRFVREGLDFTLKMHKRSSGSVPRHVTGPELLDGIRQYTLKEFGPMGMMVLNEWGITQCEHFGQIVFNLVQKGVLGKSENDKPEDFSSIFTFEDAFVKPFLPTPAPATRTSRSKKPVRSRRIKTNPDTSFPSPSSPPSGDCAE
ncbi:MAG: hypothetical protein SFU85_10420 [Candidatus Methylacidiphilales bacterium]|nr:hypothetical protein [Candidatus Methylacidiphilales bacterium]